ncbi:MAG: hypothetical protein KUG82_18285 [Pseudomonadales bacterium]|nr:hypothetical protein [Pseudomonadales bacterium]
MTKNQAKAKDTAEFWVAVVERSSLGDKDARAEIVRSADPMIQFQTGKFCRRFCHTNCFQTNCTLSPPQAKLSKNKPLCEWGNASYGWMLDQLTSEKRLANYQGNSPLPHYFFTIVNSLPFYERWKNWRFGRRIYVPTYIERLSDIASKIFFGLQKGDAIELMAKNCNRDVLEVKKVAHEIIVLLTQKKRLYLLDQPTTVSLTQSQSSSDDAESDDSQIAVPVSDRTPELSQQIQSVKKVWPQLSPVEQYILEALVIEEQDVTDVLHALAELDLTIKPGVAAKDTNPQQLYYFKRKCIAKLAQLVEEQ